MHLEILKSYENDFVSTLTKSIALFFNILYVIYIYVSKCYETLLGKSHQIPIFHKRWQRA